MRHLASAALVAALATPALALAQEGVLEVEQGKRTSICETGAVICPARAPICDDPAVARIEGSSAGLVLVGVSAGATTCSVQSGTGQRRVFSVRVTVPAPPPAKPPPRSGS